MSVVRTLMETSQAVLALNIEKIVVKNMDVFYVCFYCYS